LTFTSTFLVWLPPPENWPPKKKSAVAAMITKDHQYGHDCRATATTIIISHKIDPPLCVHNSHLVGDVTVEKHGK
jgi:hypothetical protein